MTVRKLHVSRDLSLPLDVITESVGILAVKRAGKSHTAKKLAEQLLQAHQQVVVVDPKGDWWGLRSSADGKGPGFPIVIIGGEHGDVPLEPSGGELVAQMVVKERVNLILDLSELRKHQVATFMTAFLETLYRLKAKEEYRTPLMLVIDEADAIASQKPQKGEERMLGAAEDIVRRGGQRGIGVMLVTQRAAVLNKNVLTQVGVLILLRTTGSQDIDAIDEWIKKHSQEESRALVMESIAALPRGTAWVWAPGWPDERGIFQRIEVSRCETFDSGATPKVGERRALPKTLADVDLDAFRREMAATIQKAKAEDPAELRKQVAAVQRELAVERKRTATPAPPRVETKVETRIERVPILTDAHLKVLRAAVHDLRRIWDRTVGLAEQLVEARGELATAARSIDQVIERTKNPPRPVQTSAPPRPSAPQRTTLHQSAPPRRPPEPAAPAADAGVVGGLAKRLIDALAWLEACQICPATRWQAALIAEASAASSYFGNTVSGLRTAGLVTYPRAGTLELTPAGRSQATPSSEPIDEAQFQARLFERLGGLKARLLQAAIEAYPQALTREQLGEAAGGSSTSSYFENEVSALRSIGLIDYPAPGQVVALPVLFLEGAA